MGIWAIKPISKWVSFQLGRQHPNKTTIRFHGLIFTLIRESTHFWRWTRSQRAKSLRSSNLSNAWMIYPQYRLTKPSINFILRYWNPKDQTSNHGEDSLNKDWYSSRFTKTNLDLRPFNYQDNSLSMSSFRYIWSSKSNPPRCWHCGGTLSGTKKWPDESGEE